MPSKRVDIGSEAGDFEHEAFKKNCECAVRKAGGDAFKAMFFAKCDDV